MGVNFHFPASGRFLDGFRTFFGPGSLRGRVDLNLLKIVCLFCGRQNCGHVAQDGGLRHPMDTPMCPGEVPGRPQRRAKLP